MKKQLPIWDELFAIGSMHSYEIVIDNVAQQAIEEARKAAKSARRAIGQLLRRDRGQAKI